MKPSEARMKDYFISMIMYLLIFGAAFATKRYFYEFYGIIAYSFVMSILYSWRVYMCLFYYWDYEDIH